MSGHESKSVQRRIEELDATLATLREARDRLGLLPASRVVRDLLRLNSTSILLIAEARSIAQHEREISIAPQLIGADASD